jgi:16S rRNA (cytosine1402-N4)-methyltransferase
MDDAGHLPVLALEVVELLRPAGSRVMVDCTVGLGGHAQALLEAAGSQAVLVGIDWDPGMLLKTKQRLTRFGGRVRLFQANFADLEAVMSQAQVASAEVILADLGLCSAQLDDPARGFSFQADGPLDMRMSASGPTGADLVNRLGETELADLLWRYGQERFSRRIARALVRARRLDPVRRTGQLAGIVRSAVPGRGRIDPATRTFQALRMAVNRELENLQGLLERMLPFLSIGGRAGIICFHSLEDRLVKQAFAAAARSGDYRLVTRKPWRPTPEEVAGNPRGRSARLRVVERIR